MQLSVSVAFASSVQLCSDNTVCVGNEVFDDFNGNGLKDGNDFGIPGVGVQLWAPPAGLMPGRMVSETITNESGQFLFQNLAPGRYYYMLSPLPFGYREVTEFTDLAQVRDNDSNCRVVSGATFEITTPIFALQPGVADTTIDCGLKRAHPALSVSVLTNGVVKPTVTAGDTLTRTYQVRNTGNISVSHLSVTEQQHDSVYCAETLAVGAVVTCTTLTIAEAGEQTVSAVVSATVFEQFTQKVVTRSVTSLYIGNPLKYILGNRVFLDSNENGKLDPGENGLPGATLCLVIPDTDALWKTTTDESGYYTFTHVAAGTYQIVLELPQGITPVAGGVPVTNTTDSDNNGVVLLPGAVATTIFTVGPGYSEPVGETDPLLPIGTLVDSLANFTVDFAVKETSITTSQIYLPLVAR